MKFTIITHATVTIEETWTVEAATPEEAVAIALERASEPRHGTRLEAHTGWAGQ